MLVMKIILNLLINSPNLGQFNNVHCIGECYFSFLASIIGIYEYFQCKFPAYRNFCFQYVYYPPFLDYCVAEVSVETTVCTETSVCVCVCVCVHSISLSCSYSCD